MIRLQRITLITLGDHSLLETVEVDGSTTRYSLTDVEVVLEEPGAKDDVPRGTHVTLVASHGDKELRINIVGKCTSPEPELSVNSRWDPT